jgi:hypothetical protein
MPRDRLTDMAIGEPVTHARDAPDLKPWRMVA